ncbi:MAG: hypothetical protein U0V73_05565 [Acidimicrobiia bacterium]
MEIVLALALMGASVVGLMAMARRFGVEHGGAAGEDGDAYFWERDVAAETEGFEQLVDIL